MLTLKYSNYRNRSFHFQNLLHPHWIVLDSCALSSSSTRASQQATARYMHSASRPFLAAILVSLNLINVRLLPRAINAPLTHLSRMQLANCYVAESPRPWRCLFSSRPFYPSLLQDCQRINFSTYSHCQRPRRAHPRPRHRVLTDSLRKDPRPHVLVLFGRNDQIAHSASERLPRERGSA